jgi:hypothetical protein
MSSQTGPVYFVFCRLYPSFPQSLRQCVAPLLVISPLLINTVSRVRACLFILMERFRVSQKEDPLAKRLECMRLE